MMSIMHNKIAHWLYDKIMEEGDVYHSDAVREIAEKFGEEYTYSNENGNPVIDRKVLGEFRKFKGNNITWDRAELFWHKETETDKQFKSFADSAFKMDFPKMPPLPTMKFEDIDIEFDDNIKWK